MKLPGGLSPSDMRHKTNLMLNANILPVEAGFTIKSSETLQAEKANVLPEYVITGETLVANSITEIPKLMEPLFPRMGLVALAGSSDTGKSTLLRQLAMEIVSGQNSFLDFRLIPEHKSVLYVSTEDDDYAISSLIKKQNYKNLSSECYKGLRFIFETTELDKKILAELNRQSVDVIIIDAFSDLYGGDMNRTNEVRTFLQKFANIAKTFNCLIIFLHHTSKRTETQTPSKHNMIGSQGFEAKMRLVIELRRDQMDPSGNKRHFCIVKGNYLPEDFKSRSYVLRFTDHMTFENTGQRVSFESLVPPNGRRNNDAIRERAEELRSEGLTIREIHERLEEEGYDIARSTVGNWLRGQ